MEAIEQNPVLEKYERLSGLATKEWFPLAKRVHMDVQGKEWYKTEKDRKNLEKVRHVTRKHLEETAKIKTNAPFVEIKGIGYVETPAWIVAKLSELGDTLGTPFGGTMNEEINSAIKYVEDNYGLQRKIDRNNIVWAGTAQEAVARIQSLQARRP